MTESLFEEFSSRQNNKLRGESESPESPGDQNYPETELLAVLPTVQKIVGRKALLALTSDAGDVIQRVALRLWKWRNKYADKSEEMSPDEWNSFAARTAYNEINRHFSGRTLLREVPLDAAAAIRSEKHIAGQTDAEADSLAKAVWQKICFLSVRQRRALLLSAQELILCLRESGIRDGEIARVLEIPESVWSDVKTRLPLPNMEIADFMGDAGGAAENERSVESLNKSINKARHEARARLKKLISE